MCRHHFHDIIMHCFPDIEEMRFFDNGGPNLHTHKYYMHIHKTNCFDHENIICRHNFGDDIMHNCQDIVENRCFSNGGTNLHIQAIARGRPEDNQVEFLQGPHGIVSPSKNRVLNNIRRFSQMANGLVCLAVAAVNYFRLDIGLLYDDFRNRNNKTTLYPGSIYCYSLSCNTNEQS